MVVKDSRRLSMRHATDRPQRTKPPISRYLVITCADRLAPCLKTEANRPRKQKQTLKQLHANLVSLGLDGSYNRLAAFARE